MGVGLDVVLFVAAPRVAIRVGGNVQPLDIGFRSEGLDLTLELPVQMIAAVDLFASGEFRVSGGLTAWASDVSIGATVSDPVRIGSGLYRATEVGRLDGVFDMTPLAPYVAVGLGRPGDRVGLYLDFGSAIRTSSTVRLTASGTAAGDPTFEQDLREEELDLQDEIGFFQVFPILSLGVTIPLR